MNKLLKNSSLYLLSTIIATGIPFFLLPLLTKNLSKADYGILSLYGIFINFGTPILSLALLVPTIKNYFYYPKKEYDLLLSSILTIWGGLLICFSIICTLLLYIVDYDNFPLLFGVIISVHIVLNLFRNLSLITIRNKEQPIKYSILEVSASIIEVALIYFFIVEKSLSWQGKITGTIVSLMIVNIAHVYNLTLQHKIRFGIDKTIMRGALKLSLPIIPNLLAINLINLSDRLFIIHYHGEEANGIYSLAAQIGNIVLVFSTAVGKAFIPWIYKNLSQNKFKPVKKALIQYTFVLILVAILVVPFAHFLFHIEFVDGKFLPAINFIGLLALSFSFYAISNLSNNLLINENKSKLSALIYISGALICLVLNLLLIPTFKLYGAAIATLITCLYLYVIMYVSVSLIYKKKH